MGPSFRGVPSSPKECFESFADDPFGWALLFYADLATSRQVSPSFEHLLEVVIESRHALAAIAKNEPDRFRIAPALCLIDAGLQEYAKNAVMLDTREEILAALGEEKGRAMSQLSRFSYSAAIVLWGRMVSLPTWISETANSQVAHGTKNWESLFADSKHVFLAWCLSQGKSKSEEAKAAISSWGKNPTNGHRPDLVLAKALATVDPRERTNLISLYVASVEDLRDVDTEVKAVYSYDNLPSRPRSEQALYVAAQFLLQSEKAAIIAASEENRSLAIVGLGAIIALPVAASVWFFQRTFVIASGFLGMQEKTFEFHVVRGLGFSLALILGWFGLGVLVSYLGSKSLNAKALVVSQFSRGRLTVLGGLILSDVVAQIFVH